MRKLKWILIPTLVLLLVLLAACGKKLPAESTTPEQTTPAPTVHTITFRVGETDITVEVAPGETPAFPNGTPSLPATAEGGWRFTGWDAALAPATGDVTYTASFEACPSYAIRWLVHDDVITSYVSEGEIPVCPVDPAYRTAEFTFNFLKYSTEPVAATADAVYSALYSRTRNSYEVVFKNGDTVLSTITVPYGRSPIFPGETPTAEGKEFTGWTPLLDVVTGDATYTAVFGTAKENGVFFDFGSAELIQAMGYDLVNYDLGNGQKTGPFNAMTGTYFMLMEEHYSPVSGQLRDRILEQLRSLITGGNEPDMDMGPQWSFGDCAAAIALAKITPSVWGQLTAEEVEKLDFIMQCFTVAAAFGTNDCNNYKTTLSLVGNFNKEWNPNYRFAIMVPMLSCAEYFGGAAKIDEILLSFDYDAYIAKCEQYNFTNIKTTFTTAGKTLMENGGVASTTKDYGTGLGVKQAYTYKGYTLDQRAEILVNLLEFNYSGGKVMSQMKDRNGKVVAYIADNKVSPFEGKLGMMLELNAGDAGGVRSSASYSMADLNLATVALTFLMTTGALDAEEDISELLSSKIFIGNEDLIYKLKAGYQNFSNGVAGELFKYSSYGGQPQIVEMWETGLRDIYIHYEEPSSHSVSYKMPDGTTNVEVVKTLAFVLAELPAGYSWFDGKNYLAPGSEFVATAFGTYSFDAVQVSGLDDGAYHIGDKSETLTLRTDNTGDASSFYDCGIISGKILMTLTLSGDPETMPAHCYIDFKHINAGNPATTVFVIENGNVKVGDMTIATVTPEGVKLAVLYDTNGTLGLVFVYDATANVWNMVTTFTYVNEKGTVGRLGYIIIRRKTNPSTDREYKITYQASFDMGLNYPQGAPVVFPVTFDYGMGLEPVVRHYTVGEAITDFPTSTDDKFLGWTDAAGNLVTEYAAGVYGPITLTGKWNYAAVTLDAGMGFPVKEILYTPGEGLATLPTPSDPKFLGWFDAEGNQWTQVGTEETERIELFGRWDIEGEVIVFAVGEERYFIEKSGDSVTLPGDNLPANHMWYDGAAYYNAEYVYPLTGETLPIFTAVPAAGDNGAKRFDENKPMDGALVLSSADQWSHYGSITEGKFLMDITFNLEEETMPNSFSIQYKHTTGSNPATGLASFTNGVFYAGDGTVVGSLKEDGTFRIAIAYDTKTGENSVFSFDDETGTWTLVSTFTNANTNGTAGRHVYFWINRNANPANAVLGYSVKLYHGLTAPVGE